MSHKSSKFSGREQADLNVHKIVIRTGTTSEAQRMFQQYGDAFVGTDDGGETVHITVRTAYDRLTLEQSLAGLYRAMDRQPLKLRPDELEDFADEPTSDNGHQPGNSNEFEVVKEGGAIIEHQTATEAVRDAAILRSSAKYDYPSECNTPELRKTYRRKMRKQNGR